MFVSSNRFFSLFYNRRTSLLLDAVYNFVKKHKLTQEHRHLIMVHVCNKITCVRAEARLVNQPIKIGKDGGKSEKWEYSVVYGCVLFCKFLSRFRKLDIFFGLFQLMFTLILG